MFALPEHNIAFEGLKDKIHRFEYEIDSEFFALMENEELSNGKLSVVVDLDKRSNMMVAGLQMEGYISTTCDRCAGGLSLEVAGGLRQIFKTSERQEYDDEEVIIIPSNEHELNLSNSIYECLMLAVPVRKVHEMEDCDPEVLKALNITSETQQEIDPRWNALRGLSK